MHDDAPPSQRKTAAASSRDEEYVLSETEAPLATAMALMTGYALGCCEAHKPLMADRVADALGHLVHHMQGPKLSSDMQRLLLRLYERWSAEAARQEQSRHGSCAASASESTHPTPHVLWHAPQETLQ